MNITTVKLIGYRLRKYNFKNLEEYYSSTSWKKKRQEFKYYMQDHDLVFCSGCGTCNNHLQVHHKSYKSLCDESFDQLCYFCSGCHERVHKIVDKEQCSIRIATKRVQRSFTEREKKKNRIKSVKSQSKKLRNKKNTKNILDRCGKCIDLNAYETTSCKIIDSEGNERVIIVHGKTKPKKKWKKFPVKEVRKHHKKKKKVKDKYSIEELKKCIYG